MLGIMKNQTDEKEVEKADVNWVCSQLCPGIAI